MIFSLLNFIKYTEIPDFPEITSVNSIQKPRQNILNGFQELAGPKKLTFC